MGERLYLATLSRKMLFAQLTKFTLRIHKTQFSGQAHCCEAIAKFMASWPRDKVQGIFRSSESTYIIAATFQVRAMFSFTLTQSQDGLIEATLLKERTADKVINIWTCLSTLCSHVRVPKTLYQNSDKNGPVLTSEALNQYGAQRKDREERGLSYHQKFNDIAEWRVRDDQSELTGGVETRTGASPFIEYLKRQSCCIIMHAFAAEVAIHKQTLN